MPFHIFKGGLHVDDHVVAPIPVGLGVFDVILAFHHRHTGEGRNEPDIVVDVIKETADNTEADGIVDIVEGRHRCRGQVLAVAFFHHTVL